MGLVTAHNYHDIQHRGYHSLYQNGEKDKWTN